jgi:hypothetical protein
MKKFNCFLILLLGLVLQGCQDHQQMLTQLEELERQNLADSLMTNDTLAIALCDYFDSHIGETVGLPSGKYILNYYTGDTLIKTSKLLK